MPHATGARHSMSYTPESTFGTTPTAVLRNIATVAAAVADNSYNDAVETLSIFKANDIIIVSGFTTAANNGVKHVVSATANKIIVSETLADEALGDDVTIEIVFQRLRNTGTTLNLNKDTFASDEIRSDRQIVDMRHGNKRVEGEASVEMSAISFDDLLEAALQGTWSTFGTGGILKAGTVQRSFSMARLFDDVAQMLLYDGVEVSSFALSAQINTMITGTFGLVGQSAAPAAHVMTVLPGGTVEIGDTFSINDQYGNELLSFTATAGTVANVVAGLAAAWNLSTNPICVKYTAADVATTHMTLTADTAGTWYDLEPVATDKVPPGANTQTMILTHAPARPASVISTTSPFAAFTGTIKEGGAVIATIMGLDFSLENGLDPAFVLMDAEATAFINGRSNITGTVTAYFDDLTLLNKFVDETSSILEIELQDPLVNKLNFLFPKIKYTGGEVPVSDENALVLSLPFQALYDATELTNLKITRTLA